MTPNCYLLGGGNDLPTASLGKSIAKTLGRPPLDHQQRVKWEIPGEYSPLRSAIDALLAEIEGLPESAPQWKHRQEQSTGVL
jgi:hypothetical protein